MIRVSCLMLLDIRVLHEGPGSSFFHDLSIYLSIDAFGILAVSAVVVLCPLLEAVM